MLIGRQTMRFSKLLVRFRRQTLQNGRQTHMSCRKLLQIGSQPYVNSSKPIQIGRPPYMNCRWLVKIGSLSYNNSSQTLHCDSRPYMSCRWFVHCDSQFYMNCSKPVLIGRQHDVGSRKNRVLQGKKKPLFHQFLSDTPLFGWSRRKTGLIGGGAPIKRRKTAWSQERGPPAPEASSDQRF